MLNDIVSVLWSLVQIGFLSLALLVIAAIFIGAIMYVMGGFLQASDKKKELNEKY